MFHKPAVFTFIVPTIAAAVVSACSADGRSTILQSDLASRGRADLGSRDCSAGESVDDLAERARACSQANPQKAITLYTQLIAIEPRGMWRVRRAACYQQLRDYRHAIADYSDQISLDSWYRPYLERAQCLDSAGHRQLARQDYAQVIDLFEDETAVHKPGYAHCLATAYAGLGDYRKAFDVLDLALHFDPYNKAIKAHKMCLLRQSKNSRKCVQPRCRPR